MQAATNGHVEVIRLLLGLGADVRAKMGIGKDALYCAVSGGRAKSARLLIKYMREEERRQDNDGELGKPGDVDEWLRNEVRASNDRSFTDAFILACSKGHTELVRLMLDECVRDNGLQVDSRTEDGCTGLIWSAWYGWEDTARLLLERGADVEGSDEQGRSALHAAALKGHPGVVKALIDNGAHIEAENEKGLRALHLAVDSGHTEVIKLLLDHGADFEAKDRSGRRPIHFASTGKDMDIIELLVDRGADLDAEDHQGCRALHLVIDAGQFESLADALVLLLDGGADPGLMDFKQRRPIHIAVGWTLPGCATLLIERGESPDVTLPDGRTYDQVFANDPEFLAFLNARRNVLRIEEIIRSSESTVAKSSSHLGSS
jgi:ankyrin repeat protein